MGEHFRIFIMVIIAALFIYMYLRQKEFIARNIE